MSRTSVGAATRTLSIDPEDVIGRRAREARTAGVLAGVAAASALVAVPDRLSEGIPAGVFLLVAATAQLWVARALWRRDADRLLPWSILLFAGMVAFFVVEHTVGLPFRGRGGSPHHAEPVPGGQGNGMPIVPGADGIPAAGVVDLVGAVAGLVALALLVGMLPEKQRRRVVNLLLGIAVWSFGLLALAGFA